MSKQTFIVRPKARWAGLIWITLPSYTRHGRLGHDLVGNPWIDLSVRQKLKRKKPGEEMSFRPRMEDTVKQVDSRSSIRNEMETICNHLFLDTVNAPLYLWRRRQRLTIASSSVSAWVAASAAAVASSTCSSSSSLTHACCSRFHCLTHSCPVSQTHGVMCSDCDGTWLQQLTRLSAMTRRRIIPQQSARCFAGAINSILHSTALCTSIKSKPVSFGRKWIKYWRVKNSSTDILCSKFAINWSSPSPVISFKLTI